jgi:hypothetical protein
MKNMEAKNIVTQILNDIKFIDFINNNKNNLSKKTVINLIRMISIAGELNNDTFNNSITDNFLLEQFRDLTNDMLATYKQLCIDFRNIYSQHNIIAIPNGYSVKYKFKEIQITSQE